MPKISPFAIRKHAEEIKARVRGATSFDELTRAERDAEELERNAGELAPLAASLVYYVRNIQTALENDFDRHPFNWNFTSAIARVL